MLHPQWSTTYPLPGMCSFPSVCQGMWVQLWCLSLRCFRVVGLLRCGRVPCTTRCTAWVRARTALSL